MPQTISDDGEEDEVIYEDDVVLPPSPPVTLIHILTVPDTAIRRRTLTLGI